MESSMPRARAASSSARSRDGVLTLLSASTAMRRTPGTASIRIFLPLAVQLRGENCDTGGVSTGLGERSHKTLAEHVIGKSQNWDACGRPLCGANRWISASQDY